MPKRKRKSTTKVGPTMYVKFGTKQQTTLNDRFDPVFGEHYEVDFSESKDSFNFSCTYFRNGVPWIYGVLLGGQS